MKKMVYLLSSLLIVLSCNKEEHTPPGAFTIDGEQKFLSEGFVNKRSQNGDFYPWSFYLISKGVDYQTNDVTGTGEAVGFNLLIYNKNSDELPEGTFVYNNSPFDHKVDALAMAFVHVDFNFDTGQGAMYWSLKTGEVTISKSGKNYILNFNFTFENDEVLIGTFKGVLERRTW